MLSIHLLALLLCHSHTFDEAWDFLYGGIMVVARFHDIITHVPDEILDKLLAQLKWGSIKGPLCVREYSKRIL
jgi:hypothetical protein